MSFLVEKISGDPAACQLALEIPGEGAKTIGPLGEAAPKRAAAGAAAVWVTRVRLTEQGGEEVLEVSMECQGITPLWDDLELLDPTGRPIDRSGSMSSGDTATFFFDPSAVGGKPDRCRLKLSAPSQVAEYVLKATFDDVPLVKDQ